MMKHESLDDSRRLIRDSIQKYLKNDNDLIEELNETYEEIVDLDGEPNELRLYLSDLAESLDSSNRDKCVGALAMARVMFMNVESAYSNFSDLISNVVVGINKLTIAENEEKFSSLTLVELLQKNLEIEMGSFMYDLHQRCLFNVEKFEYLHDEIARDNDVSNVKLIFNLYSIISRKLAYHCDKNDGYFIDNIETEEFYRYLDKLEEIVQKRADSI